MSSGAGCGRVGSIAAGQQVFLKKPIHVDKNLKWIHKWRLHISCIFLFLNVGMFCYISWPSKGVLRESYICIILNKHGPYLSFVNE